VKPPTPFYYGGQAVIEGVMIRGRRNAALALRLPNGEPSLIIQDLPSISNHYLRRFPFIRGVIVLIETLLIGIRALLYSAKVYAGEEEEIPPVLFGVALALALAFAILLFFILPLFITRFFIPYLLPWVSHLIEGLLRLTIFIAYLKLIGWWLEIRRGFAYHGAEHKVVNAYEAGIPLKLEGVKEASTSHPRCGTTFFLFVLIIAILVFGLLGHPPLWLSILLRLLLLPLIACLSYELIRIAAEHKGIGKWLLAPGLAIQSLTTRQPDEGQIEIALLAMKGVLEADESSLS